MLTSSCIVYDQNAMLFFFPFYINRIRCDVFYIITLIALFGRQWHHSHPYLNDAFILIIPRMSTLHKFRFFHVILLWNYQFKSDIRRWSNWLNWYNHFFLNFFIDKCLSISISSVFKSFRLLSGSHAKFLCHSHQSFIV